MINISNNQTFKTNLNRVTINNIKTKIEIIVVSKIKFSIIVAIKNIKTKIEIIIVSKIEFSIIVAIDNKFNAYNQTFFFVKIDKKTKILQNYFII